MFRAVYATLAAATAFAATPSALAQDDGAPQLELVLEEVVLLEQGWDFGQTPLGGRFLIPIAGGTFEGPDIRGEVLPGGWDWQVIRDDGCRMLTADYFIRTDDGVPIHVVNKGTVCPPEEGAERRPFVTHPVVEAPNGKYDWLNRMTLLGTGGSEMVDGQPAVRIRLYRAY